MLKRETELQAQALADGVRVCLAALSLQPKDASQKQEQRQTLQQKKRISTQRRMLCTGITAVALLLSVTALCVAAVAYGLLICWRNGYPQVIPLLLAAYAVAEVVFSVAWRRKYNRFNVVPMPHAPSHPDFDPRHAFDEFVVHQRRLSRYICIKEMLQTWFWQAPFEQIKRGNVADLITYGFWYASREQLEERGQGHLPDQLVSELEQAWGVEFEEGHNKDLDFMAHLWQPIRCSYRPLTFYLLIEYLFLLKHVVLRFLGFQTFRQSGFKYYTYGKLPLSPSDEDVRRSVAAPSIATEEPEDPSQVPILFLHGVGVGLMPYIGFIAQLACTGQPVIAFECNHLGMRWVPRIPEADEVVEVVWAVLGRHKVARACIAAHSYGTFHASRFLQLFPTLVQSICLMDPVNFNMFTGKLIHNFVYNPFKVTSATTGLVARDIHHAASVSRRFYWSVLNLWPYQLPRNTLVVLSGRDELVPVPETITMLQHEAPHTVILYRPSHKHAQFIHDLELQTQVVWELVRTLHNAEAQLQARRARPAHAQLASPHHEERTQAQLKQQAERMQAAAQHHSSKSLSASAAAALYSVGATADVRVSDGVTADGAAKGTRARKRRGLPEDRPSDSPPIASRVGAAHCSKAGDVVVEIENRDASGAVPRTTSGRRSLGGTVVRSVGKDGILALEPLDYVDESDGEPQQYQQHQRTGSTGDGVEGTRNTRRKGRTLAQEGCG